MSQGALLLVMMEPPAILEEEFNDWYDTEHFPQRNSMPGFLTGKRWVCLDGWPRWGATYELESIGALETPEYLAVSGANSTPWSKRILPRTFGRRRIIAKMTSNYEFSRKAASIARMVIACFEDVPEPEQLIESAHIKVANRQETLELKAYIEQRGTSRNVWLLASFGATVDSATSRELLAVVDRQYAVVLNLYAPYTR